MAKTFKLVVLTNAVDGQDDDFNAWYDRVHLGDVLKLDGFVAAQRYRFVDLVNGEHVFRYCAIYDVASDDPEAALARLNAAAGTPAMAVSPALATPIYAALYEPLGAKMHADGDG